MGHKRKGKRNKIRVEFRPNMAKPARESSSHWTKKLKEEPESLENADTSRAFKGKGELAKKRTIDISRADNLITLEKLAEHSPQNNNFSNGTVTAIHGQFVKVDDGEIIRTCVLRRVLKSLMLEQRNVIAVGDCVEFTPIEPDEGVIERIGRRYGMLFRYYRHKEHLIVTNVDQILIVSSVAEPELRIHLIDRYIVSALIGQLKPIIIFNKADLPHNEPIDEYKRIYNEIGYPVIRTSVVTGEGIEELRSIMKDKKTALAGVSGVGKSSLINAVQPDLNLSTRPVNRATRRGVHTTTTVQLLKLNFGGYVVDTPGIRQFALARIKREELDEYFEDFMPFLGQCKFPDCVHIHEAGCAVKNALESGKIAPHRYESYLKIYEDQKEFLEPWDK